MTDHSALLSESLATISSCGTSSALEEARISLLGKKGSISEALKSLGQATPEERKTLGAALNKIKDEVAAAWEARKNELAAAELAAQLAREAIDITLPARPEASGRLHPITRAMEEITALFSEYGFTVATGPDIEDDEHNFSALNIPESHPARQMHDTFYLTPSQPSPLQGEGKGGGHGRTVLRTHTSPVQIRTMRGGKPPFRCIAPGSTYRCDSDQTHTPMFHQIEGFVVDKHIHFGHLKGLLLDFLKAFFELDEISLRFRPSFFPFTEPSAEVDIGCKRGKDKLEIGGGGDWLEVMGCGMIHPNVLKNCGIDPNEWQGFAFGLGVERLAMLKYGIPDLRTFFESDMRWLQHYGFAA